MLSELGTGTGFGRSVDKRCCSSCKIACVAAKVSQLAPEDRFKGKRDRQAKYRMERTRRNK